MGRRGMRSSQLSAPARKHHRARNTPVAEFLSTDVVLVGVLIMAALGYGLDRMVRAIESRLVHWSGKD
jgi:hypothetical protein